MTSSIAIFCVDYVYVNMFSCFVGLVVWNSELVLLASESLSSEQALPGLWADLVSVD